MSLKNFPRQLTSFVGRSEELQQLVSLLRDEPDCRLLTVVGPGGMGKSRLALQAAASLEDTFPDGICFVPLEAVGAAEHIVPAVAEALELSFFGAASPLEQLVSFMRKRRLLLILDNFEHLIQGAELLLDLLEHAPGSKLLVTSRERLNFQEEWLLPLSGLDHPQNGATDRIDEYAAVQLFVQRAKRVQPQFVLTGADRECVVRICRLVEGTPLGIELAAAWVRMFPCGEIAREIENNLDFLTTTVRNVPQRQQSIRAAFDYSWAMLSKGEKESFSKLAIFRGGFDRDAAKQVAQVSFAQLSLLVGKSLLHWNPAQGRYQLHHLLAQYAAEKLDRNERERRLLSIRHANYYANLLKSFEAGLNTSRQAEHLATIASEIENVRTGWQLATDHSEAMLIDRFLKSLFQFYEMRSRFQEGETTLAQAANVVEGAPVVCGRLWSRQGWLAFQLGHHERGHDLMQSGLALLRERGEEEEQIFCLNYLGAIYLHTRDLAKAKASLEECIPICEKANDRFGLSVALNIRSQVAFQEKDYATAQELCEQSIAIKRIVGDRWGMAFSLAYLGAIAEAQGRYDEAEEFLRESLAFRESIGDRRGIAVCKHRLGHLAAVHEEHEQAQELYLEAQRIFNEIGNRLGEMAVLLTMGESLLASGDAEQARSRFLASLALGLEVGDRPHLLRSLRALAELLIGQQDYEPAVQLLRLASHHSDSEADNRAQAQRLVESLPAEHNSGHVDPDSLPDLETVVAELLDRTESTP